MPAAVGLIFLPTRPEDGCGGGVRRGVSARATFSFGNGAGGGEAEMLEGDAAGDASGDAGAFTIVALLLEVPIVPLVEAAIEVASLEGIATPLASCFSRSSSS